ncbi:hypothetical protein B0H19DRAFT_1240451 [Mycena capillaripes]|nr:hypothetical protein B0H19DRAFT_1240451 [Mycena capillaripes]
MQNGRIRLILGAYLVKEFKGAQDEGGRRGSPKAVVAGDLARRALVPFMSRPAWSSLSFKRLRPFPSSSLSPPSRLFPSPSPKPLPPPTQSSETPIRPTGHVKDSRRGSLPIPRLTPVPRPVYIPAPQSSKTAIEIHQQEFVNAETICYPGLVEGIFDLG